MVDLYNEYPKEFFIKIDGEPFLEGRLLVNASENLNSFWVEIDIVSIETKKIWKHLKTIYDYKEEGEAIDAAMQVLAKKLKGKS